MISKMRGDTVVSESKYSLNDKSETQKAQNPQEGDSTKLKNFNPLSSISSTTSSSSHLAT